MRCSVLHSDQSVPSRKDTIRTRLRAELNAASSTVGCITITTCLCTVIKGTMWCVQVTTILNPFKLTTITAELGVFGKVRLDFIRDLGNASSSLTWKNCTYFRRGNDVQEGCQRDNWKGHWNHCWTSLLLYWSENCSDSHYENFRNICMKTSIEMKWGWCLSRLFVISEVNNITTRQHR